MLNAIVRFLGTGFGAGLLPKMPGTYGTVVASLILSIPFIFPGSIDFLYLNWGFLLASTFLHFIICPPYIKKHGADPPSFVLDEWVGLSITYFAIVPLFDSWKINAMNLLLGFILFRTFDILKPLGINYLQKFKGSIGVVADDALAGVFAYICLKSFILIFF